MNAIYVSPYLHLPLRELCDVAHERARQVTGRVAIVETRLNGSDRDDAFAPDQQRRAGKLRDC